MIFIGFLMNLIFDGHLKQRITWRTLRTRNLRDKSDQELEGEPRHVDGLCQGEEGKVLTILSTFGLQFS